MVLAANSYINGQKAVLIALPELAAIGDAARIKITDLDTGDTATSVQGMGYLPEGFTNINSYGQEYALFVRREDAGSMGVVDAGDRPVGLLLTTGGEALKVTRRLRLQLTWVQLVVFYMLTVTQQRLQQLRLRA